MNPLLKSNSALLVALALATTILLALPAGAQELATVETTTAGLSFAPVADAAAWTLTVTGPADFVYRRTFDDQRAPSFDAAGLEDGFYRWELRAVTGQQRSRQAEASTADRQRFQGGAAWHPLSGNFTVLDGALLVDTGAPEAERGPEPTAATDAALSNLTEADQVFIDDLIVIANECVGFACVNNESFGVDNFRLKDVNNRIHFQDTSTGTFPTNDWRITANDDTSGGASYFSIDDVDAGTTPFLVEAAARNNALYVDSSGRLGMGTNAPAEELTIVVGDSPGLRLQQDSSSSFTPYTWEIVANESNFLIEDTTGGTNYPFRIRPGAPTDSIHIADDGDVSFGAGAPSADVRFLVQANTTSNFAGLRVQNASSGNIQTHFAGSGWEWRQTFRSGDMIFDSQEDGPNEWELDTDGNVTATSFNPTSDRNLKHGFETVDGGEVLDRLAQLPIQRWTYRHDTTPHLGPVAQDFHAAFGLGADDRHISTTDADGVALVAIQELNRRLLAAVSELEAQNRALTERIEALETVDP
ncbi:MAG: tail fiber domain-containing protein [Acidobacteriota bacterium]|nr:tail fiber domain-containing protein [Acidobacteriota bacterium]